MEGRGEVRPEEALIELLTAMQFTPPQKREIWEAFKANPAGTERCAYRAQQQALRAGVKPAAYLLKMVRDGDHLVEHDPTARPWTGWRWVRGEGGAAGTYVEDKNGTDPLPPGYDFTPSPTYGGSVRDPDDAVEAIPDEVRSQLAKLGVKP